MPKASNPTTWNLESPFSYLIIIFLNELKYYLSRQEEGYFLLQEYSRGLFGWSLSCGPLLHRNSSNDRLSRPHQIFDDANLLPKILPLFYSDLLSVWNTLRFQFEKSECTNKKNLCCSSKNLAVFSMLVLYCIIRFSISSDIASNCWYLCKISWNVEWNLKKLKYWDILL